MNLLCKIFGHKRDKEKPIARIVKSGLRNNRPFVEFKIDNILCMRCKRDISKEYFNSVFKEE